MKKAMVARASSGCVGKLVSAALFCLLFVTSQAQSNYQRVLSFGPLSQSGSLPRSSLLEASDGWLYGTTYAGGTNGSGTVFKVSRTGDGFTVLHSFSDGYFPCGGLVEANDGSLCGTTSSGANSSGTVFKLNKDGSGFSLLHVFPAFSGDGAQPMASLTAGKDGVLYGTTLSGGGANGGTVFSLNPNGSGYSIRHSFTGTSGGADGSSPPATLCLGTDGAFYGTTQAGGSNNLGTVFRLNPDGTGYAILHHFSDAGLDGRLPYSGLVQGRDGRLYGTTYYGGTSDLGTVFTIGTNGGAYSVLMSFAQGNQGNQPFAGLVQGGGGWLYGTTRYGGSNNSGTVFKLSTDGSGYAVLHSFSGLNGEGNQPLATLLLGTDGALYGSTYFGGDYTTNGVGGTLFKLFDSAPTTPPVILGQTFVAGHFQLSFSGPNGQAYSVLATTNPTLPFTSWTVLTNGAFSGPAVFLDQDTAANPARFYTVRSP